MIQTDILAFGAHPDDVELGMGATIAKHAANRKKIVIVDLTLGEMSSNGTTEARKKEAKESRVILSADERIVMGFKDREIENTSHTIGELVDVIRQYRPKVVAAPFFLDRHPDHELCSKMVREAVFNAKLKRYRPEVLPHEADSLIYYFINNDVPPSFIVDVTDEYYLKRKALKCYISQFEISENKTTTTLNRGYLNFIEARDRYFGSLCGFTYGEGFITTNMWTVKDITEV